ncbi:rho GTPase-activating protein 20-like isoform X3 [Planococcus citri]|uniref:rho GTPase-activating protein 20-like isoform X3 n=1 Tax=Planococcus citri TaxID=170843 RepID=UPI0031F9EFC4
MVVKKMRFFTNGGFPAEANASKMFGPAQAQFIPIYSMQRFDKHIPEQFCTFTVIRPPTGVLYPKGSYAQVQRLSEYERYFESLLNESRLDQCNVEEVNKAKAKCKQATKRGQRESDLERIQDLFPNDCLRLYDTEALTMKVKGLMRKRSGAAARLQRALSTKSLRSESPPSHKTPLNGSEQRTFLMEAPVQFSSGVQSQDRHLFLFNDLLLIAKARSGGNFKLKEKVRISEIWLTKCCLDDVSELNKSEDTSFVMGWPTTNLVVTFSTQAARDLWWNKLLEVFRTENEKEPCSTNVQVMYYDSSTNIEYCKTFSVGPEETARDCIKLALEHLEMRHLDSNQFQLWAKTARDEAPYPLIGHERPFAIKLSCLRDSLSSEDGFDLDHCNNIHDPVARCHFILRNSAKNPVLENKKNNKKSSTKTMKIGHVFRRSLSKDQSACLFGIPLCKLTDGEVLPKPIMSMLYQVFAKGPFMQGIFRKSANARLVRELRDKLDTGEEVTWEHVPVLVTAALLKDFLRSLPEPLLTTALYPQWRSALEAPNLNTKLYRMKGVLGQLPKPNHLLLIHFLCVLYHIARRSCHTLMSAANLGVCVGPSLLWSDCPNVGDDLRVVPAVVECLITHCEFLCGSHVPSLLGDLRDSGTEESDSMKRDDSSIDSLECSPPPRKDKMSLSRDSGLTMSDSQLYTPDEEESGSTSSSGYDPAFESHAKVSPSISMPTNYVRVYGGWEERLNPNYFQRQAWFRQRSRRMNSSSTQTKNDVRRSASEESLLDSTAPPPTPPRRKVHEYEQTPAYPRKSSVVSRRIDVSQNSSEADSKASSTDNDTSSSSYAIVSYNNNRKESNSSAVPMLERRFIPSATSSAPPLMVKCDTSVNSSPHQRSIENHYSNICVNSTSTPSSQTRSVEEKPSTPFGTGDYYYAVREQIEEVKNSECEDSSTLSDEDCTPHVSRSNSRGNEVVTKLRYSPAAVHSETCVVRGRLKKKEDRAAHRSRSLPPPPPYRPPPPATSRRAPITSYYLGDCNQIQKYVITRTYMDEESYV